MPNVMGREFPYTAEGMAAAQQYSQAMGMRDGGMMGFRPVGYGGGGSVPAGYQDGDVVMNEQDRVVLIEYLMDMTGMGPNTFVEMSNTDLMRAREKVDADALKAETQRQQSSPSEFLGAPEDVGNLGRTGGFIDGPIMTGIGRRYGAERLSDRDLATVQSTLLDEMTAAAQQQTPSGFLGAPNSLVATGMGARAAQAMQDPAFAMAEDERAAGTPPRMNRGGIMSLRGY